MKKLKKLLAGVLTLAMAMSMMTMTAFAAPVFDGTDEGSITIHKYNYKGDEGPKGTGTEADATKLPNGATPLPDVTFEIYQVVSGEDLIAYYNGEKSDAYDGGWDVEKYVDLDTNTIKDDLEAYDSGKTDENGVIKFENLPLGIYAVIETDAPDSVSAPTKPFLVSIPMTNPEGDGWLYNVHVYPKNATDSMTDNIELWKYGKKVDGQSPLEGVVFILQKKQDDGHWKTIDKQTSNGIDNSGADLKLVTGSDGKISITGLSVGEYRFIERSLGTNEDGSDKNPGYILDGATTYEFEIFRNEAKELNVTYKAPGAVRDVDGKLKDEATDDFKGENHPHFEVVNEQPKFDKEIKGNKKDDNSEYGVGDVITYSIAVGVPTKIAKMTTFYVTDTPINMAVKNGSVKVYEGTTDITDKVGASVDYTEDGGFRLDFTTGADAAINEYAGKEITIEYKTVVLKSAEEEIINTNDAKLTYSDKIKPGGEDEDNPNHDFDEKVYVKEDKTVSYTYQFRVIKTANSETGKGLEGVEFDLYKEVTEGEHDFTAVGLTTITGDVAKALGLDENKTWLKVNDEKLVTNSEGIVEQGGLGKGTYYLVETKTVDGYNLLDGPFEVTLSIESSTSVEKKWERVEEYKDGELVYSGVWVEKAEISTTTNWPASAAQGIFKQPVVNREGFTLPSTGGMGTFLFTFVGVAMMAAAVILFITSKKKEAK